MLSRLLAVRTRDDDPLTARRGQSLAILMLLLLGFVLVVASVTPIVAGTLAGVNSSIIALLLFLVVYLINRNGRLALATTLLLAGICAIQVGAAVLNRTPLPAIFFSCLVVAIAAAFASPRALLIWTLVTTAIPLMMNLALYRSPVPPAGPVSLPGDMSAPPLLALELILILIYWMLAGISWLTGRQLYRTLDESREAMRSAVGTRQALAEQQADLAMRNEQLTQMRQELESLVSALTVPVVPVADGVGLLPLVGSFDGERAEEVERKVLALVAEQRMRALVIDLSGIHGLKSGGVDTLMRLCAALRLLGVLPILAGLGVQGAMQLSALDVALPRTAATVQDALAILQRNN